MLQEDSEIAYRLYVVHFFSLLEKGCSEDVSAMAHWIRREDPALQMTPLLAMVDEGRLEDVIARLVKKQ